MTKLLNCGQNQKATGQSPSVLKRFVRHKIAVAGIMDVAWCIRKVCLITPKHPCALEIISSSYTNIIFLISKLSRGYDGRIIYTSRCFTHYSGRIQIHKSWSTMYEECSVGTPIKDVEIVWMWKRDEGCKMSRDHAHIRTPWKYVDVFVRARQIYVNLGLPLGLTTSTPNSAISPWRYQVCWQQLFT